MENDVIQAFFWLLREMRIQADISSRWIAAAPLPGHRLNEEPIDLHVQSLLPLLDQDRSFLSDLAAVPGCQKALALFWRCPWAYAENQSPGLDVHCGGGVHLLDLK